MEKSIKKTQYKARRTIFLIGAILLVNLFLMNFASAELFQFDNVKSYDAVKQEITITNTFGIGQDIAKIKLNTPLNVFVPRGYQKIAEIQITSYEDYNNALEQIKFYNTNNLNREISRTYDYKVKGYEMVKVEDYKTECSIFREKNGTESNLCYQTLSGSHEEERETWTPLEKTDFLSGEIKTIGIFTEVLPNDKIEWIPQYYGKTLDEFASWTEALNSSLLHYYRMANTGTPQVDSILTYANNLTNNNGTLVTGKIGNAQNYNGTSQFAYTQANFEKTGNFDFSFDLWFKRNANTSGDNTLFDMGTAGGGVRFQCNFATNTLQCDVSGSLAVPVGVITDSNFHHLVFNYSSGAQIGCAILDGVNITCDAGLLNLGGGRIWIGKQINAPSYFNGTIDEIAFWNRTLSNSEMVSLWNSGSGLYLGQMGILTPRLVLNSPVDYFNTSTPTITFNISALDYNEGGGIKNVSLSIDGSIEYTNTTGVNGTYTYTKVLSSGFHNWSVLAWNQNATYNQSETRYINLTILSPTITLYTPDGVTNYNVTFVRFNTSVTDNLKVQNVSLYIDSVLNETNTSNYNGTYIFDRYLSEGSHTWYILAYDNESNPSQSSTINFKVDLTSPVITFTYPLNQTYYTPWANISNLNVTFNWTSYDANLNYCWYSKNGGANITLTCNTNLTTNTTYGSSVNLLSCANDSVYNIGCSSRTATYKYILYEINQSYNNPVLENTPQDYYASIYLDPSLSINNVYFTYNGTNYSASYSNIGNYTQLKELGFYSPGVLSNVNNTITWWVLLNDSSRINLSTKLQQVNNLIYSGVCNATYPYYLFNFTLKDEKTQLNINGTIETDIRFKTANGTNYIFNWTSTFINTSSYLCSNFPVSSGNSYIVDGIIKYYASNENYSTMVEYYNFLNFSYNNNTYYQNISLYDLNSSEGTEFQLTFKDSTFRTREDILIYVYRQYIPEGTFKIVELPKTDSNGQTVLHLVRNDVVYNLIAVDSSGNVLGTLSNVIAFCQDYTIGDCKINFQGTTVETDLDDYIRNLDLSYTLSFDDATNIISFIFASTTNDVKNIRVDVINQAVVTNRTICSNSLSAISGTINCDVSSIVNTSSAVFVKIYLDNDEIINESMSLDNSNWNVPGVLFFGFLLLLVIGIMFIESKEGLVIAVILGFIVLVGLGIAKGKVIGFSSGILWLIIVGVILLIKLNKEKQG